jgi:hypothetical protein
MEWKYRVLCADGLVRCVHDKARCANDNAGNPYWIDGAIIDVTKRSMPRKIFTACSNSRQTA